MNKGITIGISILFIITSLTPMVIGYKAESTDTELDKPFDISSSVPAYTRLPDKFDSSEELLLRGKIAYAFIAYSGSSGHPFGTCYFDLDDPGNIIPLRRFGGNFLAGGTWTTDGRWLGCEFGSGVLWEIDPETGVVLPIGGGGMSCNGLAWDPVYNRLYGTTGTMLIEYDPDTGKQTVIGSHGQPDKLMIALAINLKGVCYAWDVLFSGESTLWTIDLWTGEATEVASMGEPLVYAQDGAFDWDTGILYLAAYYSKGQLKTCDIETGELTLIGDFEGGAELDALAIPLYNCSNPQ